MNLGPYELFFALLIGHAVADYPLQGDFLAKAKNHKLPIPGINWWIALSMHCLMHGGTVWFITGSVYLGLAETIIHFLIDWMKCEGITDFIADQWLHVECKLVWVLLVFFIK